MPRHTITPESDQRIIESFYRMYATSYMGNLHSDTRLIGVDHLTGVVLEQRVALEACR